MFLLRSLNLSKSKVFQDSSMALEAFLEPLTICSNLKEITLKKSVVELIDFDFLPCLNEISSLELKSLTIEGESCPKIVFF